MDSEHIILTGRIVERQQDLTSGEHKYVILGETNSGNLAVVVAKISPTGKLVIHHGLERNLMICDYCGKDGAKRRYKTQVCGPKNDKFLVDKVPVVRCPHCHQTYMTAQTAKTLDQLVQQRRKLARPQTLDVIEFA